MYFLITILNHFCILHLENRILMVTTNRYVSDFKDNSNTIIRLLKKQRKGITVCHLNAQSLVKKVDELKYLFEESGIEIICISETWFDQNMPDSVFCLNNYVLYRADRLKHAGGAAIYIKKSICCKIISKSPPESKIEYLFIEVLSGNNKLLIGTVYRPNCLIETSFLIDYIQNISLNYNDIIISGDFNSNVLRDKQFLNEMLSIGLYSCNLSYPTHFTKYCNTLLDLFFVGNLSKCMLYDQISCPAFSKHDIIFMTYNFQLDFKPQTYYFRDFKNIDYENLYNAFNCINWNSINDISDVDEKVNFLENNIHFLFNEFVPLKLVNIKNNNCNKPWFNNFIKNCINERNLAFNRWKKYKNDELYNIFKIARNKASSAIAKAKTTYYENKFKNIIGSKKTWNAIRQMGICSNTNTANTTIDVNELNKKFTDLNIALVPDSVINTVITNSVTSVIDNNYSTLNYTPTTNYICNSLLDIDTSDKFNFNYFTEIDLIIHFNKLKKNSVGLDNINPKFLKILLPYLLPYILNLFNTIIMTSKYPSSWKNAKVIPVPKSNNEFRPISILSYLSKVFESLMHEQINNFLLLNKFLTDKQSGYRSNHSCITALLKVTEDLRARIDDNEIAFLVLLDHSKAFDTIDHNVLISKLLLNFKFSYTSAKLIMSYITNRYQTVEYNNKLSSFLHLKKGVPQGSVLGPLLFSLYINDLPSKLNYCNIHMYADDVQLYLTCKPQDTNECIRLINCDILNISNWAQQNYLKLNPDKSKCIIISRKSINIESIDTIILQNEVVEYVETIKNLGVVFNTKLSWSNHINVAIGKVYGILRALRVTKNFTPTHIRLLLAKTYLLPTLLYGCEIFGNSDSNSMNKLNVVYNNIARYIFNIGPFDHISQYSFQIFSMTFSDLLKFRMLTQLHKIIYTQNPKYLFDKLIFLQTQRSKMISHIRCKHSISDKQFFIYSIRLWNSLPPSFHFITNQVQFKNKLKAFYSNLN